MAAYTQDGRPIILTTPLGKDVLVAVGLHGTETVSQPYRYTVHAKALRTASIAFDGLMGQPITVALEMPGKKFRHFSGVCVRVMQGESDADLTDYSLDFVPKVWLLSKKSQSRIFQHVTVPDILKKVFAGYEVTYELPGSWQPRDYCVQYRETDFNFASRLMEEEGIYYYFKHAAGGGHTMTVANTPQSHVGVPGPTTITYKTCHPGEAAAKDFIYNLNKTQDHVSGKFLLWDHTFELPHEHLEAEKPILDSVTVGKVTHKLKLGTNANLEIYDFPGEYAQRFDGIDRAGGEQPAELTKIKTDNKRTVDIRQQAEAATSVAVRGSSAARQLATGHKFTVATEPTDLLSGPIKAEGEYVVTSITHSVHCPANFRGSSGQGGAFRYDNSFVAIPSALPFRPARTAPKPVVTGSQTAQVVGPPGEEIFTDKYGRIKVQFHWDREGKRNADSSCWIRVGTMSAGRHWGSLSIPRIGQEVIVDFLEGDPDLPIVVGSVYNPDQMPMYKLPDEKTKSYVRTNSSMGGVGYNEIRFEDKAGTEQIYVHAQRNKDERVRNDSFERIGMNRHLRVGFYLANDHKGDVSGETKKGSQFEEVAVDQHLKVHRNKDEHVGGNMKLLVGGVDGKGDVDIHIKHKKQELIDDTSDLRVKKAVTELYNDTYDFHVNKAVKELFDATHDFHVAGEKKDKFDADHSITVGGAIKQKSGGDYGLNVGGSYEQKAGMKHAIDAGQEIHLKAGMNVTIEAGMNVTLKVGGNFVSITPAGVAIQGTLVLINSGGAAGSGSGAKPASPAAAADAKDAQDAKDADPTKPTDADHSKTGEKSN